MKMIDSPRAFPLRTLMVCFTIWLIATEVLMFDQAKFNARTELLQQAARALRGPEVVTPTERPGYHPSDATIQPCETTNGGSDAVSTLSNEHDFPDSMIEFWNDTRRAFSAPYDFPISSHPKEGARINSNAVLENPTHAQWPQLDRTIRWSA